VKINNWFLAETVAARLRKQFEGKYKFKPSDCEVFASHKRKGPHLVRPMGFTVAI
jgi:hypothetical protein